MNFTRRQVRNKDGSCFFFKFRKKGSVLLCESCNPRAFLKFINYPLRHAQNIVDIGLLRGVVSPKYGAVFQCFNEFGPTTSELESLTYMGAMKKLREVI